MVGRIYAASAFGSILGTFATGFIFIAYIGTIRIVWAIAIFLFLLSFFLWRESVWRGKRGVALLFFIFAAAIFFPGPCTRESQYYCIGILSFHEEGRDGYMFRLDHLTHSFVFLDDPSYLKYDYEKVSSWFIEYASRERGPLSILFLGGGGYTLPRYLAAFYPEHRLTVVEIDPAVTEANYMYLGLPRTTPITTINDDARRYLQRLPEEQRFDIIIGDAFNDFSVPFHLTTREFDVLVKRHLQPNGFYLANNIDDVRFGRFLASRLATSRLTFPFASFAPLVPSWEEGGRNTFLVVGAPAPFDEDMLRQSVPRGREAQEEKERTMLSLLSQDARDDFTKKRRGIVLTDEYAPVDNFLAAVFRARR